MKRRMGNQSDQRYIQGSVQADSTGPRGIPGPYAATTEIDLVRHVLNELRKGVEVPNSSQEWENPKVAVDKFALMQAIQVLGNYERLLCQPIYQLLAPGLFNSGYGTEETKCVRQTHF